MPTIPASVVLHHQAGPNRSPAVQSGPVPPGTVQFVPIHPDSTPGAVYQLCVFAALVLLASSHHRNASRRSPPAFRRRLARCSTSLPRPTTSHAPTDRARAPQVRHSSPLLYFEVYISFSTSRICLHRLSVIVRLSDVRVWDWDRGSGRRVDDRAAPTARGYSLPCIDGSGRTPASSYSAYPQDRRDDALVGCLLVEIVDIIASLRARRSSPP